MCERRRYRRRCFSPLSPLCVLQLSTRNDINLGQGFWVLGSTVVTDPGQARPQSCRIEGHPVERGTGKIVHLGASGRTHAALQWHGAFPQPRSPTAALAPNTPPEARFGYKVKFATGRHLPNPLRGFVLPATLRGAVFPPPPSPSLPFPPAVLRLSVSSLLCSRWHAADPLSLI